MELTGKIIVVKEVMNGTSKAGNPWMKQEYVLEVPGQYPRRCAFTVFGEDRIKQLNIQNGEDLTIQFDIDAREYNGRWYNDFRAYNVIRGQQIPQLLQPIQMPPISDLPIDAPTSDLEDPFRMDDRNKLPF